MLKRIKRLEQVADLLTKSEFETAMSRIFKDNKSQEKETKESIDEANDVLNSAKNRCVKQAMLQLLEINTYKLNLTKEERKEAKAYLARHEDEWAESPIDLGEIMRKIFAQA